MKALLDPQVTLSEAATDAALAEACRRVKDVGSRLCGPALLLAHVAARLELLAAGKWPTVSGSAQPERVPASDHLQAPLALVEVGHCKLQAVQGGCGVGHSPLPLHRRLALGGGMWPLSVVPQLGRQC